MFLRLSIIILCIIAEHGIRISMNDFLEFSYNSGASFGFFKDSPDFILILSVISCAVVLYIVFFTKFNDGIKNGLSILIGGALSNLSERIIYGHVIDWIPVPFPFTIIFQNLKFNLADIEISIGALTAMIYALKKNVNQKF